MNKAVFNDYTLSQLQSQLEEEFENFKALFCASALVRSLQGLSSQPHIEKTDKELAESTLRAIHNHFKRKTSAAYEDLEFMKYSSLSSVEDVQRLEVCIDYMKAKQGFLWLEILSLADIPAVQPKQSPYHQEELCLF